MNWRILVFAIVGGIVGGCGVVLLVGVVIGQTAPGNSMNWLTWGAWIGAGLIGAVVNQFIIVPAQQWLFGPKVKIYYRGENYGLHTLPNACWLRLTVTNTGRSLARNCRAYLTDIRKKGAGGEWGSNALLDCFQLHWSHFDKDQPQTIDIPTGVEVNVDLVYSREDDPFTLKPALSRAVPSIVQAIFSESGDYKLTVVVAPENGPASKPREQEIKWGGSWADLSI